MTSEPAAESLWSRVTALRNAPVVRTWWVLVTYLVICVAALPWHLHRIGPDASAYLTIARKWHALNITDAVNGYWSPLFSWLIAVFLGLGFATDVTAKCVQVGIGACGIVAVWCLARRLRLPSTACVMTALCVVPATAVYALKDSTPDLLVAVLLVGYLAVVVGEGYPRSPWQGAACGLLGAFAYLAKAYAFPFFLAHYVAVSVYLLARRGGTPADRGKLLLGTAVGLLVFAVLAGPWIGLLSRKYGQWTFSTTGAYQARLVTPGNPGNPLDQGGLYPPPNPTAVSAWEDPTELRIPAFSPARQRPVRQSTAPSKKPPQHAARPAKSAKAEAVKEASRPAPPKQVLGVRYIRNVVKACGVLFRLMPAWPAIMVGLVWGCWLHRGTVRDRSLILLGTLLLYPSGYILLFIEQRYFWFMTYVLAASAFALLTIVPMRRAKRWRVAWTAVLVVMFAAWPAWIMARTWHHVLERVATLADRLHDAVPPGSRLASDAEFGISNSLAYHLGAHYHGMLRRGGTSDEHERQLREQNVDYVLIWGDPADHPFLASARELPSEPFVELRFGQLPRLFTLGDTIR